MSEPMPWMYLEQARNWIYGAMENMGTHGNPCRHCVLNAMAYLKLSIGETPDLEAKPHA